MVWCPIEVGRPVVVGVRDGRIWGGVLAATHAFRVRRPLTCWFVAWLQQTF